MMQQKPKEGAEIRKTSKKIATPERQNQPQYVPRSHKRSKNA
jgi:hypothetical protein